MNARAALARTLLFSAIAVASMAALAATGAPPSVETFFQKQKYGSVVLSPSGRYLAVVLATHDHYNLGVVDLDTRDVSKLTDLDVGDVIDVHWLTDDRLVFTAGDLHRATGEPPQRAGIVAI